jgi:riboflavin biosynthesis pyrimidine reductase
VRQIFPATGPELDVITRAAPGEPPAAVRQLADLYRNEARPATGGQWLRANMVASTDGATALSGRSGGLGGPADRMVFTVLRSLADIVLVGAGTARAEHYRPVQADEIWTGLRAGRASVPTIAVLTSSLDLDDCPRLLDTDPQTILITATSAPAERVAALQGRAEIVTAGQDRVDIGLAIAALADRGARQILCEGGPHVLGQLVTGGRLDELCLTTSPILAGGSASRIVAGASEQPATLGLAHVLAHDNFLISRYIRR